MGIIAAFTANLLINTAGQSEGLQRTNLELASGLERRHQKSSMRSFIGKHVYMYMVHGKWFLTAGL